MKKFLTAYLFLILFYSQFIYAQTISPGPGFSTVCPSTAIDYDVSGPTTGCSYTWTVTNGKFQGNQNTGSTVWVIWDDVAKKGKLKVTATCGSETHSTEEEYVIHSLKDVTPQNPRAYQTLPYCSTTPINLAVDRVDVPNTGGSSSVPVQPADGYEWTLPSGQVVYTTTEYYTYQPINGCIGGFVSVRAYVDKCTPNFSNSVSISVSRPATPITVAPPSGYAGSSWCNQNGVTFTATSISCFSNYVWSFPSGWTGPGGTTSPITVTTGNTITLFPSGSEADAGAIVAKVNLDCGTQLTSSAYNVTYNAPTTYISGNALICTGSTTYSVANAPSGITTSWSSSNSSLLSINSSTGVATRQGTGNGSVIITANVQGCRSLSVTKTVWVGKPKINSITAPDAMLSGQSDLFINSSSGGSTYSWLVPSGWTVQSPNNFSTWITVGGTTSGTYNVYATTGNTCGSTTGSTPVTVTGSGGGCLGAMSLSPNPATSEVVVNAAPPPCFTATETESVTALSLSSDDDYRAQHGSVVVTDHMGVVYRQATVEGAEFSIDVSGLKPGVYIVKYTSAGYTNEARLVKK